MCSIFLTNKEILNLNYLNFFLKFRGPDATTCTQLNGISFVHNLLSINGEFSPQPFEEDQIVALYNGEFYNDHSYPSDGYLLIPSYKRFGTLFPQTLDGEFALALVDFAANKLIFATDVFRTKPLWYAVENGQWGISSYRTPLEVLGFGNIQKVPPNAIYQMDLTTFEVVQVAVTHRFDLNQHKWSFDDWTRAFEHSIHKRTRNIRESLFIGLSSGYDSGAIACELDKQKVDYTAYTVVGKEILEVVEHRKRSSHVYIDPHADRLNQAHEYIMQTVEPFPYTISSSSSDYNEFWLDLRDDSGSNGLSMVCAQARKDGCKIYLSGMGADELFSDYGFQGQKIYPHSNFGGLFPDDLSTIFPWNSFYGSSMESYLAKEESVSGSYGIESRYPFLDRDLVQEFLWLAAPLKNSAYKSVLHNYMITNNYPFVINQKIGF